MEKTAKKKSTVIPQTRAMFRHIPGRAVVIRTEDGRAVVLAPDLARDIAQQILSAERQMDAPIDYLFPVRPALTVQ